MRRYRVTAMLEAPVAIKRNRQSERSEGVRSIAGTLVRGALAAAYLQQHGAADERFQRIFLDENACRFGSLDPAPRTFPLTAAACKREGVRHALVDQLWFRIAQHHLSGELPDRAAESWTFCGRCGADLKAYAGFWSRIGDRLLAPQHDRHNVAAHVGIDRATTTAAESIFYTLEALAPTSEEERLCGWLDAEDDVYRDLSQLLEAEDQVVYIGHHRTRGYGRVQLTVGEAEPECDAASRRAAWVMWSESLLEFLGAPPFAVPDLDPEHDFFCSLTFPSGAILVDEVLRYTLDPAAAVPWLPPLTDPAAADTVPDASWRSLPDGGRLQSVAAVTRQERVRGWNAAHGLPRQDEWAVQRGAVYAYRFQGTPHQRDAFCERLRQLAGSGVGVRRNEGFGLVEISDDFHRRYARQEEAP